MESIRKKIELFFQEVIIEKKQTKMEYYIAFVKDIMTQVGEWYMYDGHMHNGHQFDEISAIDIEETPSEDIAKEIREWVMSYYKATYYIDWTRDDHYGFGIGRNANGVLVEGGISFDWNVQIDKNGNVIDANPQSPQ